MNISRYIFFLVVTSAAIACSKQSSSPKASSDTDPRIIPALDQVQEASLNTSGDNLYLTSWDAEHRVVFLDVTSAATSQVKVEADGTKALMQPVIEENFTSGGDGGILRYSDSGELKDVHLAEAATAIRANGVTPSEKLLKGQTQIESEKMVDAARFSPGSIWIVSVHSGGSFILAVKLVDGFEPSTDVYGQVKIQYKVLEYKPE